MFNPFKGGYLGTHRTKVPTRLYQNSSRCGFNKHSSLQNELENLLQYFYVGKALKADLKKGSLPMYNATAYC
jgi:hypothetical protein